MATIIIDNNEPPRRPSSDGCLGEIVVLVVILCVLGLVFRGCSAGSSAGDSRDSTPGTSVQKPGEITPATPPPTVGDLEDPKITKMKKDRKELLDKQAQQEVKVKEAEGKYERMKKARQALEQKFDSLADEHDRYPDDKKVYAELLKVNEKLESETEKKALAQAEATMGTLRAYLADLDYKIRELNAKISIAENKTDVIKTDIGHEDSVKKFDDANGTIIQIDDEYDNRNGNISGVVVGEKGRNAENEKSLQDKLQKRKRVEKEHGHE